MGKEKYSLVQLKNYAEKKGYSVEVKHDHIVAKNWSGCIRTANMESLKKVVG